MVRWVLVLRLRVPRSEINGNCALQMRRDGLARIDLGKSAYHHQSQNATVHFCAKRIGQTLEEFRRVTLGVYDLPCPSFATSSRTSPLSRSFSFVNFRPRLSISRRSPSDSFSPSRFSSLIFFGSVSPS